MSLFNNIGKKVAEAAQGAAKKSGELVETTKLNISISAEESKIEKAYLEIGKKAHSLYKEKVEFTSANFEDFFKQIEEYDDTIKSLKMKMLEARHVKLCSGCGIELEETVVFCSKCGTKQETIQAAPQEQPAKVCSNCKAEIKGDSAFCGSCGTKAE